MIVYAPPNTLPHIDEIYVVLSVDEGGEGIVAAPTTLSHLTVPLFFADPKNRANVVKLARLIAKATGKKMRLVKFSTRTVVEEIEP